MSNQPLIDRIQAARGGDPELFPDILTDVMIALGQTELQAADMLQTSFTNIGPWAYGSKLPTSSVREISYERMICRLEEHDVLDEMWRKDARRAIRFFPYAVVVLLLSLGFSTYVLLTR